MPLPKSKKKEVLEKVSEVANDAKSVVFVNFHGLTVGDSTAMRQQLRKAGVKYTVAKKTLAKKAFTEKGVTGEMPELDGELALAYGDDLLAPAREVYTFEKKFDGKLSILGGVFEGKYMTKDEMTALAAIPPRETLYGMFVNLINSPIQRVVIALDQIAQGKSA
ncbi:MAG: 50S ribosomal protein L10 [Patescibacteria group bacterium]